jgi:hypothetical protein
MHYKIIVFLSQKSATAYFLRAAMAACCFLFMGMAAGRWTATI